MPRQTFWERKRLLAWLAWGAIAASLVTMSSSAATPSSGTLTLASGPLTYTGGPFVVANVSAQANGTPICNPALPCDDFALTVSVPAGTDATRQVKVNVTWPVSAADFDVYILQGSTVVATAASSSDPEVVILPAVSASYTIRVVPFAPAGQSYTGTISLIDIPPAPAAATGIAPRYQNYAAPGDLPGADSAGEPSIGIDWIPRVASLKHDKVNTGGVAFFTANLNEFRVSFDDCSSPAKHLWEDVTSPFESQTSLDPIGFVDPQTGRVFQSQLAGVSSIMSFSDDDGLTWIQSQGSGQPAGVDHQTVGGGPYNHSATPAPPPHPLYANQVYYASQDVGTAFAARSDDGGLTFGPSVPMWNLTQCGGLHGHIKVGPDGTVYVPNKGCGGTQGVAVSTDNGLTWAIRTVPGSTPGDTDPSVGIGSDNTLYFGYQNGDGHPHIAVSTNKGVSWTDQDAGQGFIKNCVFPEVTAGDGDRAAFGFLGTPTAGNYQDTNNFRGVWHFYIATTFDRGVTYTLVDATPNDPVQIGSICTGGTTCGADRNLLDFNDIQVDKEGRVLAAYADGCVAPDCTTATAGGTPPYNGSRTALSSIIRQSGGKRLFAAFDPSPVEPVVPAAPRIDGVTQTSPSVVHLEWSEPDNGGSPLTGYKIYRRLSTGTYGAPLATLTLGCPACKTTFDDTTILPTTSYFYKVTATNAIGEGTNCGEFPVGTPTGGESACVLPGLTILSDPAGDIITPIGQTTNPGWDLRKLSIAEPFAFAPDKLVFTLKVESFPGGLPPENTRWPIQFLINGGTTIGYWVDMSTFPTDGGSSAAPVFKYGTFNPTGGSGGVYGAPNTRVGNAEPLSTFNADGTITIVVPRSAVGNPAVGANLNGFLIRVRFGSDALSVTPDNMPDSLGPASSYTIIGNVACAPNTAPVANLTGAPKSGTVPLTVNFSGAGSTDADPGDTIASYTFDFGDGSPAVTQSTPTIMHTYNSAGAFNATLRVTDSHGKSSDNVASVVIQVQAPTPNIGVSVLPSSVPEDGTTNLVYTLTRSGSTASALTVNFSVGGTASFGSDYTQTGATSFTASSGTVTFNAGNSTAAVTVDPTADSANEPDETVVLTVTLGSDYNVGSPSTATGTIQNDDPVPAPDITINVAPSSVAEDGTTNLVYTLTRSGSTASALTVNFSVGGTASFGSDYTQTGATSFSTSTGTVTFNAGNSTATVTVDPSTDSINEADETVLLTVTASSGYNVGNPSGATGTIANDDSPQVQFSAAVYSANEADLFTRITVTRIGDISGAASVRFATSDATDVNFECDPSKSGQMVGAASRKCDYHIAVGRLRFAAGEASREIILSLVDDVYHEGPETLTIGLSSPVGVTVGSVNSASITIVDNDSSSQPNPIDGTPFYVRMLYVDLLSREPEPVGYQGWIDRIDKCGQPGQPPPPCDRVTVGGEGFLQSAEFFDREFFVIRLYRAGLGRILRYDDVGDLAYVSGFLTSAELELSKQELVAEIMSRPEFSNTYASLSNSAYVEKLIQTAAVTLPAGVRDGWVNGLNGGTITRAAVFRELSERSEVSVKYLHEAQVASCYYGFFTRNPDAAYFDFLQRLDRGEITLADLANAFINSSEYRQRFGP